MKDQQFGYHLSQKGLTVWRIKGTITSLIEWLIVVGAGFTIRFFEWPIWILYAAIGLVVIATVFNIWIIPTVRWRHWRYEVREQEIELQYGLFVITRTLVPMVRVQHVDTEQGPILRKYGLATITVSTAATVHEIPALEVTKAEELRHAISALARVAEEDV